MPWNPPPVDPADHLPRRVGDSLAGLTRQLGLPQPQVLSALFTRWPDIVGEVLAAHVQPLVLDGSTLSVSVDDPTWATHVRYLADDIVTKVNEAVGDTTVASLSIRVAGQPRPSRRSTP